MSDKRKTMKNLKKKKPVLVLLLAAVMLFSSMLKKKAVNLGNGVLVKQPIPMH